MLGHVEVDDAAAMVGEERPPGLRGPGCNFGMSRETVRSATARPSFRSSPWIRGAPQSGFAVAMRVIKALISAWTAGRPPVEPPESFVQYSRKRRRCHRRTVSGVTMTRACLHPDQTMDSPT